MKKYLDRTKFDPARDSNVKPCKKCHKEFSFVAYDEIGAYDREICGLCEAPNTKCLVCAGEINKLPFFIHNGRRVHSTSQKKEYLNCGFSLVLAEKMTEKTFSSVHVRSEHIIERIEQHKI